MLTIAQAASAANFSIAEMMDELQRGNLHAIKMITGYKIHEVDFKAWKRGWMKRAVGLGTTIEHRGRPALVTRLTADSCWIQPEGMQSAFRVKWEQLSRSLDGRTISTKGANHE